MLSNIHLCSSFARLQKSSVLVTHYELLEKELVLMILHEPNGSVSDHGRRHFYYFLYPLRSAQFRLASIIVLAWILAYSTHAILNCFRLHLIWTQSYRQTIMLQPAILFKQSQKCLSTACGLKWMCKILLQRTAIT